MADTKQEVKTGGETYTPSTTKSDDDLTIGEYIDRHSFSSESKDALKDMNNDTICRNLGIDSTELVSIQKELGHKLPEGAN